MRIGLVCPDVPGHLNPLTTLGRELQKRGHEVSVFGLSMARRLVERADLAFVCLDQDGPVAAVVEETWAKLAASSNLRSMFYTGQVFGLVTKVQQAHLPQALQANGIEGLVVDQLSPAAFLAANQLEIPCAIASNALAMYWDPLMPPPPLAWGYRQDFFGRVRNLFAKKVIPLAYYWLADVKSTRVDPFKLVFEPEHGFVQIAQQPDFFDFPREQALPVFHYTGPWHRPDRDDGAIDFPWEWLDNRPLIYASMGTLQNRLGKVFKNIIEAVRHLPMQVVLSKGGGNVEIEEPLPDNVMAVEFAPQLRLLERAAFAITHAGLNTALECLSYGVPMLCLPVTNDQPGVAKRVEWIGAGRVIPVAQASTYRIRKELSFLLNEPSYRENAQKAKNKLATNNGVSHAADLVEQAFYTKTKIFCPCLPASH